MWTRILFLIAAAALIPSLSFAQTGYGRSRRGTMSKAPVPGAYKDVAGTFQGKLKSLTGKEIVIENEDSQIVTLRRNRKTKFLKDEKEIKASDIDLETAVTVEASEDVDLKPMALRVTVDTLPKKTAEK